MCINKSMVLLICRERLCYFSFTQIEDAVHSFSLNLHFKTEQRTLYRKIDYER
jgi:hypothetical protein